MNTRRIPIVLITLLTLMLWTAHNTQTTLTTHPISLTKTSLAYEPPAPSLTFLIGNPTTTTAPQNRRIPDTVLEQPTETIPRDHVKTVSHSSVESLICSYAWDCGEAIQVAQCESNLTPGAISPVNRNGTRDWGLMQINDGAWKQAFPVRWANVLDPEVNLEMAWHIYQLYGWQPWTCRP